jgi:hypothetical protein
MVKNRADQARRERFLIRQPPIPRLIPAPRPGQHAKVSAILLDVTEALS